MGPLRNHAWGVAYLFVYLPCSRLQRPGFSINLPCKMSMIFTRPRDRGGGGGGGLDDLRRSGRQGLPRCVNVVVLGCIRRPLTVRVRPAHRNGWASQVRGQGMPGGAP